MNKVNLIYKDENGEYFKSVEKNGEIVLSNPSYPFCFTFEALGKLTLIGSAENNEHLIKKEDYQFHEGNTLEVEVEDGNLKVKD